MKPLAALFAVCAVFSGPVHSQSQYPKAQIEEADRLNAQCRGGSGSEPSTMRACEWRDIAVEKLARAGWCYGKPEDVASRRTWQRCQSHPAAQRKPDAITGYVFSRAGRALTAGEPIAREEMIYVLYLNVPCSLPLAAAATMQAGEILQGSTLSRACWAPNLSPLADEFTIVSQYGHVESGSLLNFVEAKFRGDGTVTAVGPAISRDEYQRRMEQYHRSMR